MSRKCAHWQKSQNPQRLVDLLLMNTIFFASLRIISAHRHVAGCDQNEEETLIIFTTLTKVYDPYQNRLKGKKNSSFLKDYYLTSRMLDSAQHPQPSERKETNNAWMKELDAVSMWVYGRAPESNKTTRTEMKFLFHSHWKANQQRAYYQNLLVFCDVSKWNQLTKPPSL